VLVGVIIGQAVLRQVPGDGLLSWKRALRDRVRREIKGLLEVLGQIAGQEAHGEDVVLQGHTQGTVDIFRAVEPGEFQNLVQVVASVEALLGQEFFQEHLVCGEALAEEDLQAIDAGQQGTWRTVMRLIKNDGPFL